MADVQDTIAVKELRCEKFGIAGTPVAQQTGYAVPTDLATCIASLTTLRTALINLGLTTTV